MLEIGDVTEARWDRTYWERSHQIRSQLPLSMRLMDSSSRLYSSSGSLSPSRGSRCSGCPSASSPAAMDAFRSFLALWEELVPWDCSERSFLACWSPFDPIVLDDSFAGTADAKRLACPSLIGVKLRYDEYRVLNNDEKYTVARHYTKMEWAYWYESSWEERRFVPSWGSEVLRREPCRKG